MRWPFAAQHAHTPNTNGLSAPRLKPQFLSYSIKSPFFTIPPTTTALICTRESETNKKKTKKNNKNKKKVCKGHRPLNHSAALSRERTYHERSIFRYRGMNIAFTASWWFKADRPCHSLAHKTRAKHTGTISRSPRCAPSHHLSVAAPAGCYCYSSRQQMCLVRQRAGWCHQESTGCSHGFQALPQHEKAPQINTTNKTLKTQFVCKNSQVRRYI